MAITFDSVSSDSVGSPATTLTYAHTCTGSSLTLIVGVTTNALEAHTSVTYNGVAMTNIATIDSTVRTSLWRLFNPDTGANDVVVTWGGGSGSVFSGAISLAGTNTLSAGASANATGSGTAPSVNITTTQENSWIVDSLGVNNTDNFAVNGGQTKRWQISFGAGATLPTTSTGAYTTNWTVSSAAWAIVALEVKEAVDVTVAPAVIDLTASIPDLPAGSPSGEAVVTIADPVDLTASVQAPTVTTEDGKITNKNKNAASTIENKDKS